MNKGIYIPERQLQEMERACNKIVTNLNREKTKVLLTAARKVRKRIKEKAPRGPTGNLKKAAYAKALPERINQPSVAFAGIRPRTAPHGHLLEYGTVKMAPHPFFRPAVDGIMGEIKQDIATAFKQNIEGSV